MELREVVLKETLYCSYLPQIKVNHWCTTLRALSNPVFHVNNYYFMRSTVQRNILRTTLILFSHKIFIPPKQPKYFFTEFNINIFPSTPSCQDSMIYSLQGLCFNNMWNLELLGGSVGKGTDLRIVRRHGWQFILVVLSVIYLLPFNSLVSHGQNRIVLLL